jgi:hypothetical protein
MAGAGLALLMLAPLMGLAQGGTCPLLVQQALEAAGGNCNALDRNSVCYGFNRVSATFNAEMADAFFSQPSDRAGLDQVDSLTTAGMDVTNDAWGIAVMNIQANLPGTLPGQAVTLMLIGDAAVENAVPPEDAVLPGEPVPVMALVGANIRSGPTTAANVLTSVPGGTELQADAVDAGGAWVRVVANGVPGWISVGVLDESAELTGLPAFTPQSRAPMQAFTLKTGLGRADCIEAPPSLAVVQGPRNINVELTVNGADIAIGSTIVLRLLEGNRLELIVLDGRALLDGVSVPTGFKTSIPLDPDGNVAGSWSLPVPLTADELALFASLELIPANLLHYPIDLPAVEDILETFQVISGNRPGGTLTAAACAGLQPTSPLGGMAYGSETFFWNGIAAATAYRVNLYNDVGLLVASFETSAPNTSLVGDTSVAGSGYSAAWEVQALVNGAVGCTSARVSMSRAAPPGPQAPSEPSSTPDPLCDFDSICEPGQGENFYNCSDC